MKKANGFWIFLFLFSTSAEAQSVFSPLGTPGVEISWARDISGDGSTVVGGGYLTGSTDRVAFRWNADNGLEILGGTNSDAHAVSANGLVAVGQSDNSSGIAEPFRWTTAGGLVSLGVLDDGQGVALGVSADGSIVVGESGQPLQAASSCTMTFCEIEDPGSLRAFHWTQNTGITAFSGFADYPLSQATGISADGSLVVGNEYTYLTYGYCFVDSFQRCQGFRDIRLPLRSLNQAAAEAPFGLLPGDIVAAVSADGSTPCWA